MQDISITLVMRNGHGYETRKGKGQDRATEGVTFNTGHTRREGAEMMVGGVG